MDQCEVEVEAVGERSGTLGAPGVGGDDDGVFVVEVLADVAEGCGLSVEAVDVSVCRGSFSLGGREGAGEDSLVDWHVEEALDLAGVQVHGDDMVAAGTLQHVCDELGADGGARLVLLILASVGEVWHDCGDAARRCRLAGFDDNE